MLLLTTHPFSFRHGSEDGATVAMAWCCVPGRGRYSPLVAPRVPPTPTCTAPVASTAAHAPARRPLLLLLTVVVVVASLASSVQAYGKCGCGFRMEDVGGGI